MKNLKTNIKLFIKKVYLKMKIILRPSFLTDKETHALYGTSIFLFIWKLWNINAAIFFTFLIAIAVESIDGLSKEGDADMKDVLATILIPSVVYFIYLFIFV